MSNKIMLGLVFGLLVLGIGSFSIPDAFAALDSKGTEFLIAFQENFSGTRGALQVHISGDVSTQATITYPSNNPTFSTTVNVNPGQITTVDLPRDPAVWPVGTPSDHLVKVTAPQEITIYTSNLSGASSDAALALPTDTFSFKYVVNMYSSAFSFSQFVVFASSDNTLVTITPSVSLSSGQPANVPFTITLNKGEGFSARTPSTQDLSGSIITADKPVGLTNGNGCTQVPIGIAACDHIYEHGIPVQGWGTRVLIADLPDRPNGSIYRIFASEDNTQVSIDGSNIATLNEGQFHETPRAGLPGGHIVTGDKPIFVVQYITGIRAPGATNGDPAMANIVPTEQFLNSYTFSTVGGNQFVRHFVTIVAANSDLNTIKFDGATIGAGAFTPIGSSGFSSTIRDNISQGTHTTSSSNGHGILVGGYNSADSYLYPGGAAFEFINPQPEDDRDGDGVFDVDDACPDEFAETPDGCPLTEITEINCDIPAETETEISVGEDNLLFSAGGTCEVVRGDTTTVLEVNITVDKNVPGFEIPESSVVNLNSWTDESFGDSDWDVSGDGLTVVQNVNGDPTFFYGDFNSFNTQFNGKIIPGSSGLETRKSKCIWRGCCKGISSI
jgi:hypothetical protein